MSLVEKGLDGLYLKHLGEDADQVRIREQSGPKAKRDHKKPKKVGEYDAMSAEELLAAMRETIRGK